VQLSISQTLRVMFYNCENLFYPTNDSLKNDDDFTPEGKQHWTFQRYHEKLRKVSQVIIAAGNPEPPFIIGLCEIENKSVLRDLVKQPLLEKYEYRIIHYESPDKRGIDVACLYNRDIFKLISSKPIPISFTDNRNKYTRDILELKGTISQTDTVFVFINHWPSKVGGDEKTEGNRIFVANCLRKETDSICNATPHVRIIIVGDLNEEPGSQAIQFLTKTNVRNSQQLINISELSENPVNGTIRSGNTWELFDQFIVSQSLFDSSKTYFISKQSYKIMYEPFLLEENQRGVGNKPFRTYKGQKYSNGFSDHLPVILELHKKEK
jgi:hypothetical protein